MSVVDIPEACPHCDEAPPADQLDLHVARVHADLPPCRAFIETEHRETYRCAFRVGHDGGEYGDWHASQRDLHWGRYIWNDTAIGATPHRDPEPRVVGLDHFKAMGAVSHTVVATGPQGTPTSDETASHFVVDTAALQSFTLQPPPNTIQIMGENGTPLVTIHPTGELEYGPDYTPDEAARCFWDALRQLAPARCPACGHIGLDSKVMAAPGTAAELGDALRIARANRDHWQQVYDRLDQQASKLLKTEGTP